MDINYYKNRKISIKYLQGLIKQVPNYKEYLEDQIQQLEEYKEYEENDSKINKWCDNTICEYKKLIEFLNDYNAIPAKSIRKLINSIPNFRNYLKDLIENIENENENKEKYGYYIPYASYTEINRYNMLIAFMDGNLRLEETKYISKYELERLIRNVPNLKEYIYEQKYQLEKFQNITSKKETEGTEWSSGFISDYEKLIFFLDDEIKLY